MRRMLLALVATGLLVGAEAPGEAAARKEVVEQLKKLNDAFAQRDVATISRLVADEHVSVISPGVRRTKTEDIRSLSDYQLTGYVMHDSKVAFLGNDTALVTYRATITGKFKGQPYPENNYVSSLWVRRGGKWVEVYYQETAAEKK